MQIKYDKDIDATYIHLRDGKINHTRKENDWFLVDCSKDGEILGIEILEFSKNTNKFLKIETAQTI